MTAVVAPGGGGFSSKGPAGSNMQGNSAGMKEKIPSGMKKATLNNFTPEQMELFQSLFQNVSPDSFLGKLAGGDQSMFEEMEAPAMRQFNQLQGEMGSRFSGMGMGARRGSGFQNAGSQATSDFAQDLQSKRLGLRNQAIKDLMGMSGELLNQKPQENALVSKAKPWWQEAATAFAGGAGQGLGRSATSG
jgi:hypothetical protein